MADGGVVCAQILLTVFNVIQFLFGWMLIIVGAVITVNKDSTYLDSIGGQIGVAIFLIVIGCILVLVSLAGCFGAWTKNYCLLVTFCVFTSIVFILVLIAVIIAFVGRSKVNEIMEPALQDLIMMNNTERFDSIQIGLKCCGINEANDWKKNPEFVSTAPASCCGRPQNYTCSYNDPIVYKQGCKGLLIDVFKQPLLIIGAVAAACAIALILAIVSAAYMANSIRSSYHAV